MRFHVPAKPQMTSGWHCEPYMDGVFLITQLRRALILQNHREKSQEDSSSTDLPCNQILFEVNVCRALTYWRLATTTNTRLKETTHQTLVPSPLCLGYEVGWQWTKPP